MSDLKTIQKIQDTLQKAAGLLQQGKFYQYSQKISSLANRRLQSKKYDQALLLLEGGARNLLKKSQINEGTDLMNRWVSLLETQEELFNEKTPHIALQLFQIQWSERRAEIFQRFLKKYINKVNNQNQFFVQMSKDFIKLQKFAKAEKYVCHLPLESAIQFLKRWQDKLDSYEVPIVYCRFALLKVLHTKFSQADKLLKQLGNTHPLIKMTNMILKSLELKSKVAFQKIGKNYSYVSERQASFKKIYEQIGNRFFGIQKSNNQGFLGFLE